MSIAQQLALAAIAGREEVDAARDAADEAAELVEALEEKVRAGDRKVTPAELVNARELARIAKLQVEAAERAAERMQADARHRAYAAHGETVADGQRRVDAADAAIVTTFDRAREALAELWKLSDQRSQIVKDLFADQSVVTELANQHSEGGMLPELVVGLRDAPNAELVALPLDSLLTEKLAEHRLAGGRTTPWSRELLTVRPKHARQAYPHLAPPTVDAKVSQLWTERHAAGGR